MDWDSVTSVVPARAKAAVADRLHPDWRNIIQRAWSFRLIVVAFVLSGAEVVLPLFTSDPPIPIKWFAVVLAFTTGAAFIARLYAQKNMGVSE